MSFSFESLTQPTVTFGAARFTVEHLRNAPPLASFARQFLQLVFPHGWYCSNISSVDSLFLIVCLIVLSSPQMWIHIEDSIRSAMRCLQRCCVARHNVFTCWITSNDINCWQWLTTKLNSVCLLMFGHCAETVHRGKWPNNHSRNLPIIIIVSISVIPPYFALKIASYQVRNGHCVCIQNLHDIRKPSPQLLGGELHM